MTPYFTGGLGLSLTRLVWSGSTGHPGSPDYGLSCPSGYDAGLLGGEPPAVPPGGAASLAGIRMWTPALVSQSEHIRSSGRGVSLDAEADPGTGDANFDILPWPIADPSVIGYYTLSDEVRIRVTQRPVRSVTREALGKSVVMTRLDVQPDDRPHGGESIKDWANRTFRYA